MGHPPYHVPPDPAAGDSEPAAARTRESRSGPALERRQGQPQRVGHLGADDEAGAFGQGEDEGPDHYVREGPDTGVQVVEFAQQVLPSQGYPGLLGGFALGGMEERAVRFLAPAAGQADLAGPGVRGVAGPADEQGADSAPAGDQDQRHGGQARPRRPQTDGGAKGFSDRR